MNRAFLKTTALSVALAVLSGALAFEWSPGEFPTGDQSYTLEFRFGEGESVQMAGYECVVIRLEMPQQDGDFEFALAEDLPFPCFSRYGSGEGAFQMRLLSAE